MDVFLINGRKRSRLPVETVPVDGQDFVFSSVTGNNVVGAVIYDNDQVFAVDIQAVTPNGGDITIQTDNVWSVDAKAKLVQEP
jgi:hypothetical protein